MPLPILEKKAKVVEAFAFALQKFLVCSLAREMLDEVDLRGARIRQGEPEIMVGRLATKDLLGRWQLPARWSELDSNSQATS